MKIQFVEKHKSISGFDETEIEDFSIFLGKNGSGKTHLLKAMCGGFVKIDEIDKEKISYFSLQDFFIKNQKPITSRKLDDEKMEAWNILKAQIATFKSYDDAIEVIVKQKKYPYQLDRAAEGFENHKEKVNQILKFIDAQTKDKPKIRKLLKTGIFESGKYSSQLTETEFSKYSNYDPYDYEILESLSEIFFNHQKRIVVGGLKKIQGGDELDEIAIKQLEEDSPWQFLNTMFNEFDLKHSVSFPKFTAGELLSSQAQSFQVKLSVNSEEFDFEDLSSGEKVLCSLAITMYQDRRTIFPELLLLDEVDATLHPSMIKHLLDVIQNVFVRNNCKVILASHSPTTIALSPEQALFEVQEGNVNKKIQRISQIDAIELLSEKIMTLEKGIKIFDSIFKKKLTIISEGKNNAHIKRAIEVMNPNLLDQIQLYVHDADSGAADLYGLFEFIKRTEIEKDVLFVWDCDQESSVSKRTDGAHVFRFCFSKNTANAICKGGIENLYPDGIFTDNLIKRVTIETGDEKRVVVEFNTDRKDLLLEKILNETNENVFENFGPLVRRIAEINDDTHGSVENISTETGTDTPQSST